MFVTDAVGREALDAPPKRPTSYAEAKEWVARAAKGCE
jgi:hypothetical protein